MLELNNVEVLYSDVILAVKGISAKVPDASCVTLLGANGAGKSTTLKAISNLIKTEDGRVSAGRIDFGGQAITGHEPSGIVRQGIVHVMEGRKVLRHMSVEQNLVVGGHMSRSGDAKQRLDEVYGLLASLKASGLTLLIVEQNTRVALELADYGYVMESGRVVLEGPADDLKNNEDVREFYLGLTLEGERKSYRDMKHYRRRKRWLG